MKRRCMRSFIVSFFSLFDLLKPSIVREAIPVRVECLSLQRLVNIEVRQRRSLVGEQRDICDMDDLTVSTKLKIE